MCCSSYVYTLLPVRYALQCVAVQCVAVQCVAVQCVAVLMSTHYYQWGTRCSVLQFSVLQFSVLQFSVLQFLCLHIITSEVLRVCIYPFHLYIIVLQPIATGVICICIHPFFYLYIIIVIALQPIAIRVFESQLNLNLQSQSPWSLFDGTWQKGPGELDHRLRLGNEARTLERL